MVQGVTAGGTSGGLDDGRCATRRRTRRDVVMPVRPAQIVYANFKHIQVRPDSRLQDGVPLYKLRILDTLIDQLSPKSESGHGGSVDGSRQASIDSVMITEMSSELRPAGGSDGAYRAGFLPAPGAFVDLVA